MKGEHEVIPVTERDTCKVNNLLRIRNVILRDPFNHVNLMTVIDCVSFDHCLNFKVYYCIGLAIVFANCVV